MVVRTTGEGVDMAFESFLQTQPRAAFEQALGGLDQPQSRFFRPRFNQIYNRFLAELPNQPTLQFSDFLESPTDTGPAPLSRGRFLGFSPFLRGERQNILTPRARFLNF